MSCSTTKGNIIIDVRIGWAPLGAKHFKELIRSGYFNNLPFTRVCPKYITQFGIKNGQRMNHRIIKDDATLWGIRDIGYGYLFFAVSQLAPFHCENDE